MRVVGFLSAEEERDLIARAQRGDETAKSELVEAFQPLLDSEAKRFLRRGGHMKGNDLVQEATIGLLYAVKDFDPSTGFRLATLAKLIIRRRLARAVAKQEGKSLPTVDLHKDGNDTTPLARQLADKNELSATCDPVLTPVQEHTLAELAGLLSRGIHEALPPQAQALVRIHYWRPSTITDEAGRLRISRPTFYKLHDQALSRLRDFLGGRGIGPDEARAYLAAINPRRPFSMKVAKEKDPVRLRSAEDIEVDEREKGLAISAVENRHQMKEVAA